ncbi:uncharacterized protein [Littorina saxatilis]|uniref:uncharacterized protein isoform X2 n=1 Tax=Littorina saxatilis TaxID=31220 RepID=UPI0038B58E1E
MAEASVSSSFALKELKSDFAKHGASGVPPGLLHILCHAGSSRKEVYKAMWGSLMFVAKLATGGKRTLVYPKVIREAVRERFEDPTSGAYDEQYEEEENAYHVTMEDLVAAKWRVPPKSCKLCSV